MRSQLCLRVTSHAQTGFYGFVLAVTLLSVGCRSATDRISGRWTGSGQINMPPTGNPEIDALEAANPSTITLDLQLNENLTYVENVGRMTVTGKWELARNVLTLKPEAINGEDRAVVKKRQDEANAKRKMQLPDMPGMSGPEMLTVSDDQKRIEVPSIGTTITLSKREM
jgi:hypothetical protein